MEERNRYRTLEDIEQRKDEILAQLRQSDKQMKQQWHSIFKKPDPLTSLSPAKRMASLMSNSIGALDVMLLTWKLYRKYKKKRR